MSAKLVMIGANHVIEDNVILGRMPERFTDAGRLVIGRGAIVRSGSILYAGTTIGDDLETGHNVVIREQNTIGDSFSVWSQSCIDYGCRIGAQVKIHCLCYIAQFTEVEDDVFIGPGVIITNDFHPGCEMSLECMKGPHIMSGAVIGGHATILPHVTIGEKALVGAGSVVTHDVESETVVAGNPARALGSIYNLDCVSRLRDHPYCQ